MRYLKHTSISLLMLTALSFSALAHQHPPKSAHKSNLAQTQTQWTKARNADELKRMTQRATFLQLENLLKSAVKNNNVSDNAELYLKLIESLKDYPLKMDAMTAYFDARIKSVNQTTPPEEVNALKQEIEQAIAQNPTHFLRTRWEQSLFTLFQNANDLEGFVHYAQRVKPSSLEMQIAVLNAELQQDGTENTTDKKQDSNANTHIISRYEQLWLANSKLPNDAQLWAAWYARGGRTAAKVYQKAETLFAQNDENGLAQLATELHRMTGENEDEKVAAQLQLLQTLIKTPASLAEFSARLPMTENNTALLKFAVLQSFPRYLRTLPENMKDPSFAPYAQWAKNWQLTDMEMREWEIAFLNRFFDNESPLFQQWRDAEILKLNADSLTERRLRMAIWQKTDLTLWLNALSDEGRQKQEWRYWFAKTIEKSDSQKTTEIWTALSHERGFYPMLAAAKLDPQTRGKHYHFGQPQLLVAPSITDEAWADEFPKLKPALEEIAELRQLDRLGAAKQRWRFLLENLPADQKKEKQIALSQYANQQNWFDLGVDGSIIAKAFDYIQLRLPMAYSHYYDIALKPRRLTLSKGKPQASRNTPISKTFAMAISRQESAWNLQAQSSANARGLMQLLPSTAKATASHAKLPYTDEAELFKPLNNILLGTAYLAELNAKYPNNRILIASAYNAGEHRVEKWLARANGKLEMDEFVASIPFYETRGYVQNVLTYDFYYQRLQNKEDPQTFSNEEYDRLY
ncbi:transglycosylase SLT domain-containing protein [Aggregatibacter sp. oral taxon 458]|uniref:transglycosylase SLT domain-containing protein n=1 Tax=Aggregatibacter sp. oral taxon 458 TaxID=712148 RepID=UPI00041AFD01|nr:transglycosylase SLT domain-containing protein [Aggregatibacter sp. oral taxon 458]